MKVKLKKREMVALIVRRFDPESVLDPKELAKNLKNLKKKTLLSIVGSLKPGRKKRKKKN